MVELMTSAVNLRISVGTQQRELFTKLRQEREKEKEEAKEEDDENEDEDEDEDEDGEDEDEEDENEDKEDEDEDEDKKGEDEGLREEGEEGDRKGKEKEEQEEKDQENERDEEELREQSFQKIIHPLLLKAKLLLRLSPLHPPPPPASPPSPHSPPHSPSPRNASSLKSSLTASQLQNDDIIISRGTTADILSFFQKQSVTFETLIATVRKRSRYFMTRTAAYQFLNQILELTKPAPSIQCLLLRFAPTAFRSPVVSRSSSQSTSIPYELILNHQEAVTNFYMAVTPILRDTQSDDPDVRNLKSIVLDSFKRKIHPKWDVHLMSKLDVLLMLKQLILEGGGEGMKGEASRVFHFLVKQLCRGVVSGEIEWEEETGEEPSLGPSSCSPLLSRFGSRSPSKSPSRSPSRSPSPGVMPPPSPSCAPLSHLRLQMRKCILDLFFECFSRFQQKVVKEKGGKARKGRGKGKKKERGKGKKKEQTKSKEKKKEKKRKQEEEEEISEKGLVFRKCVISDENSANHFNSPLSFFTGFEGEKGEGGEGEGWSLSFWLKTLRMDSFQKLIHHGPRFFFLFICLFVCFFFVFCFLFFFLFSNPKQ